MACSFTYNFSRSRVVRGESLRSFRLHCVAACRIAPSIVFVVNVVAGRLSIIALSIDSDDAYFIEFIFCPALTIIPP